jgi:hypothetical protein
MFYTLAVLYALMQVYTVYYSVVSSVVSCGSAILQ